MFWGWLMSFFLLGRPANSHYTDSSSRWWWAGTSSYFWVGGWLIIDPRVCGGDLNQSSCQMRKSKTDSPFPSRREICWNVLSFLFLSAMAKRWKNIKERGAFFSVFLPMCINCHQKTFGGLEFGRWNVFTSSACSYIRKANLCVPAMF